MSLNIMIRTFQVAGILYVLIFNACSLPSARNTTSGTIPTAGSSYKGIPLPLSDEQQQTGAPPPAWLIFGEQAFPAYDAAFETLQAHGDPAEAFPDLLPIDIPEQTEFIIIISSDSVHEFRASVVPWDSQINPIPLIELQGQSVPHTLQEEKEFTVFKLTATYPTAEQFLHVFITFFQPFSSSRITGYVHYLWRIALNK